MPLYRFGQIFLLLICVSSLPALAAQATTEATGQTEPTPQIVTAAIRLDDLSMIIVPVSINDSGPYAFLLDTGSGKTMVDQKLADELGLPQVGERKIMGILGSTRMSVVRARLGLGRRGHDLRPQRVEYFEPDVCLQGARCPWPGLSPAV